MLETDENVFFTDSPGASNAAWPSRDLPDREQKSPSVFLPWGLLLLSGKIQRDFANKLPLQKQACKPRNYASSKLCVAKSLTGVKCRATSVAKKQ